MLIHNYVNFITLFIYEIEYSHCAVSMHKEKVIIIFHHHILLTHLECTIPFGLVKKVINVSEAISTSQAIVKFVTDENPIFRTFSITSHGSFKSRSTKPVPRNIPTSATTASPRTSKSKNNRQLIFYDKWDNHCSQNKGRNRHNRLVSFYMDGV